MNRWWAPEGPETEMTSGDLALLAVGDDAQADLGLAIFAMHRAGAAGCLNAAQTPLVSTQTLVNEMAGARRSYAPFVVESVSKSLGSPSYAGLLVADLADDAERGAVDLFRSAVAKGVAPPLAAQRTAMVYGVPTNRLGPFRTLALTPQANPVALQDAADRALFSYVESVVNDEMAAVVSKADYLESHNEGQDARGRFTRLRERTVSAADKARQLFAEEEKVEEKPAERQVRPARATRPARAARATRAAREVRAPAPTSSAQRTQARTQTRSSQRYQNRALRRAMERLQGRELELATDTRQAPAHSFNEVMAQIASEGGYHIFDLPTDDQVSMFLSRQDFFRLADAAMDAGEQFRMGHITRVAEPVISRMYYPSDSHENVGAAQQAQMVAMSDEQDIQPAVSIFVPDRPSFDAHDIGYETVLENPEHAVAMKYFEETGAPFDPEVYDHILGKVVGIADRTGEGVHFIYAPEGFTTINEIRVQGPVKGEMHGGRKQHVELDPNATYEFAGQGGTYWDAPSQSLVVVHYAHLKGHDDPFEEPIGKAGEYLRTHNETQDTQGRFTRLNALFAEEQVKEAAGRMARPARASRASRQARAARPERVPARPAARQTARSTQRATQRNTTREVRRLVHRLVQAPPLKIALGHGDHTVISGERFNEMVDALRAAPYGPITLDKTWASYLSGREGMKPEEITSKIMKAHHLAALDARENHYDDMLTEEPISLAHGDLDYTARQAEEILSGLMKAYPQYSDFAIEFEDRGVDIGMSVYGSPLSAPPVIVTNRVDDWDAPVQVRLVSKDIGSDLPMLTHRPDEDEIKTGQWDEPMVLTYARTEFERYVLENAPGHKDDERG